MKKNLLAVMAFALILFMLGSGAACAHAEQGELLCDVCGGTVVTERMVPIFGLIHAPECRHRVMDPSVRTFHDKNGVWAWDEQEHWQLSACCSLEQPETRGEHVADCQALGVCLICGAPYDGELVGHRGGVTVCMDAEYHWEIRGCCGKEVEHSREKHAADCAAPGICKKCGTACTGEKMVHQGKTAVQSDGEYHWEIYLCCGAEVEESREEHRASCLQSGVCLACSAAYTGENREHTGRQIMTGDAEEHWLVWDCCGLSSDERSNHVRDCRGEEKCLICDRPYSGNAAMHSGEMQIQSDSRRHWDFWPCCGLTEKYDEHWRRCDQMDVCTYCGIACQAELFHTGAQEWHWDDETHWRSMTCCGTVTDEPQAHWNCQTPGQCATCGIPFDTAEPVHLSMPDEMIWMWEENEHWIMWECCGQEEREPHFKSLCVDNQCAVCSMMYEGDHMLAHEGPLSWSYDQEEHWQEWLRCCGREKEGSRGMHAMKEICLALPGNGGTLQGTVCTVCGKANYQASGVVQEDAAPLSPLRTEEMAFGQVQLMAAGADEENAPEVRVESVRNGTELWIHVPYAENGTVKLLHVSQDGKIREPECDFEEAGFLFKVKKAGIVLLFYPAGL